MPQSPVAIKHAPLIARLIEMAPMSAAESAVIQDLSRLTKTHAARSEIWDGVTLSRPSILIAGWACRQRILGDGRRQIIHFILPGDPVGDWSPTASPIDSSSVALTEVITADVSAIVTAARDRHYGSEGLATLVSRLASNEAALLQNQVVRLGRQTAYERMVHLILELQHRLHAARIAAGNRFAMPLTQEVLADCLGLSVVHVNRTLMHLRRDGMLEFQGGTMTVSDPMMMRTVADWVSPQVEAKSIRGIGRSSSLRQFCPDY